MTRKPKSKLENWTSIPVSAKEAQEIDNQLAKWNSMSDQPYIIKNRSSFVRYILAVSKFTTTDWRKFLVYKPITETVGKSQTQIADKSTGADDPRLRAWRNIK